MQSISERLCPALNVNSIFNIFLAELAKAAVHVLTLTSIQNYQLKQWWAAATTVRTVLHLSIVLHALLQRHRPRPDPTNQQSKGCGQNHLVSPTSHQPYSKRCSFTVIKHLRFMMFEWILCGMISPLVSIGV